jgi:4'-phosphopantetheinyl transferase
VQLNWPEPSDFPELVAGTIHVWAVPLDVCKPQLAACESLLSHDERARAAKFVLDPPRQTFVISRAALRKILGQYLGVAATNVKFVYDAFGKPQLVDAALSFNVAHSGELTLIAVSRAGQLGIDVERMRNVETSLEIAAKNFHADELNVMRTAHAAEAANVFLRCWTRKEAILKSMGVGLGYPLDAFNVLTVSSIDTPVELPGHESHAAARYWLCDLDPASDYRAAVAANFASPPPFGFAYSLDRLACSR